MIARNASLASHWKPVALGLLALSGAIALASPDRPSVPRAAAPAEADDDARARRRGPGTVALGSGGECFELPYRPWFGAIRPLPQCLPNSLFRRTGARDINRDGVEEVVDVAYEYVSTSPPQDLCLAELFEIDVDAGAASTTRECILTSLEIMPYLQSVAGPGGAEVLAFQSAGWHDVDRDSDLDLCVIIVGEFEEHYAWLENTGFEATQPLTGDLNSDGNVNSADLALLLGGWTGG